MAADGADTVMRTLRRAALWVSAPEPTDSHLLECFIERRGKEIP